VPFFFVLSGTLFNVSFFVLVLCSTFSYASDISTTLINDQDVVIKVANGNTAIDLAEDELNKTKIDWSKPIVSRGFGLEKSLSNSNEIALKEYQSGQVFYFFGEYDKAIEKWLPLLDLNFPEAQASMGWLYQAGLGVEKNEKMAFELYKKSAEQNNAIAQNNLGVMYENGIAVEIDFEKATYWYRLSAEQGYRFGQYNYANSLLLKNKKHKKNKTDQTLETVKQLLQKSADQGVKQAKIKLKSFE